MDPTLVSLLGLLGQAGASLYGEYLATQDEAKVRDILQKSLDEFGNISLPKFESVVAQEVGPTALNGVKTDQRLTDAQYGSLGSYDDIISGDGLAAEDQANLNRIGNQLARRMSANKSSVQQGMQAQGMGNSGAAIAAQMAQAQNANQDLAAAGYD